MRISDWSSDVCSSDLSRLAILGDGTQTKSYIHVADVVDAVLTAHARETRRFQVFNVSTLDAISVTGIGRLACRVVGLDPEAVRFDYAGGDRVRSEEHTSELQSLMRISYAVFCLKKKNTQKTSTTRKTIHGRRKKQLVKNT